MTLIEIRFVVILTARFGFLSQSFAELCVLEGPKLSNLAIGRRGVKGSTSKDDKIIVPMFINCNVEVKILRYLQKKVT